MFDITQVKDVLHVVAQALLYPATITLLLFIAFSLFSIGSLLVESFTERRRLTARVPELLAAMNEASVVGMEEVVITSGLLKHQKAALVELIRYRDLPQETHIALAKRLLANEDMRYQKIVGRTDLASKIAPMLGLLGTLIPLGPGIMGLSSGDIETLSNSMLVAFDSTIAGLATAVVCYSISKLRKRWYEDYMISLESLMTCILEKVDIEHEDARAEKIDSGSDGVGVEKVADLGREGFALHVVSGSITDDARAPKEGDIDAH